MQNDKSIKTEIAIIGGGLAGLTSAYYLEKQGKNVILFEASNRLGGRVKTIKIAGKNEEAGGQFIDDAGPAVYLNCLSKELNVKLTNLKYIYNPKLINNGKVGNFSDFANILKETLQHIKEDKRINSVAEALKSYLKEHKTIRKIMEVRYSCYDGDNPDKLSFKEHIATFISMSNGAIKAQETLARGKICIADSLEFANGTKSLISALSNNISNILLDHQLLDIEFANEEYILKFANNATVITKKIILAVPLPILKKLVKSKLFPSKFRKNLESFGMGSSTKIFIPLKKAYPQGQFFVSSKGVTGWFSNDNILTIYLGGKYATWCSNNSNNKKLVKNWCLPVVKKIFPDIEIEEDVENWGFYNWVNEPFIQGSYSYFRVTKKSSSNKIIKYKGISVQESFAPINDSIFICGEHTATKYNGTMESAIESGYKAASLILGISNV